MLQVTEDSIEKARDLIADGKSTAVGYRIIIKPIEARKGLEKAEMDQFPTLASSNFEKKTNEQTERETKGTQYGIVLSVGPGAYTAPGLGDPVKEGDVVIFERYAGLQIEMPPGSGKVLIYMNDESIIAKMEPK